MQLLQQCEALLMLARQQQQQVQAVTQQQHVQQLWTALQHTLDLQSAHILQVGGRADHFMGLECHHVAAH